jgi:hypothetical protein
MHGREHFGHPGHLGDKAAIRGSVANAKAAYDRGERCDDRPRHHPPGLDGFAGSGGTISGLQRLDSPAPPTELSELSSQINTLRDQFLFAQQLASELTALADTVGGPVPSESSDGKEHGGIRAFRLSEIDQLIRGLGGALGSIQSDIARLRRYVG